MSFLDKMKEAGDKAGKSVQKSYQEHQEKVAELKDTRGARLGALPVEYMGGYGDKKKTKGVLTFFEKQTEFNAVMSTKFTIPNTQIQDIVVEGKDEVNRRVTVTRLLAVGIFAFALKKKNKDQESYITLELADGQEVILFVDNKAPMALRAKLAKVISAVKQTNVSSQSQTAQSSTQSSVADELAKLASLKEQGVLSQAEFDSEKAKILET
jgi:5S rRNA maturation endonuclease (ribonuclease M5)